MGAYCSNKKYHHRIFITHFTHKKHIILRTSLIKREMLRVVSVALAVGVVSSSLLSSSSSSSSSSDPIPPEWPHQFHATLLQNRSGSLARVELYYDWVNGRNYNIVYPQLNDTAVLWDLEYMNGTTFYYTPGEGTCRMMDAGVGILKPTWLSGSKYLGRDVRDTITVDVYNQSYMGNNTYFARYYNNPVTETPVGWTFFDGADFTVLSFTPGVASVERVVPIECAPFVRG